MRMFLFILLLAACDASPAPQMIGSNRTKVTVDGRDYTIWRHGTAFEIVRHGWAPRADRPVIMARMVGIVAQVTGCKPHAVQGDSAEMRGRLNACG